MKPVLWLFASILACISVSVQANAQVLVAPNNLEIWYGQVPDQQLKVFGDEVFKALGAWQKKEKEEGRSVPSRVQIVLLRTKESDGSDVLFRIACDTEVTKCLTPNPSIIGVRIRDGSSSAISFIQTVVTRIIGKLPSGLTSLK